MLHLHYIAYNVINSMLICDYSKCQTIEKEKKLIYYIWISGWIFSKSSDNEKVESFY